MAGCRNPNCSGKNPVLPSGWCTGSKCKDLRKQVKAAEKEATEQQARALAGVAAPAQCVEDGLQCWQVHSVHGQMECGIACLGGVPVLLPLDKGGNELRLRQAGAGILEQVLLAQILLVDLEPCRPAA